MRRVASVMRQHLFGVLNAVPSGVTDALAESIHAEIQWIERTACEFRDRERSRDAIFCHWGGLDLHPASLQATTRLPEAPRTTASLLP